MRGVQVDERPPNCTRCWARRQKQRQRQRCDEKSAAASSAFEGAVCMLTEKRRPAWPCNPWLHRLRRRASTSAIFAEQPVDQPGPRTYPVKDIICGM
jgi:hypothetical protein